MKAFEKTEKEDRKKRDADETRRRRLEDQRRRRKRQEDEKRRIWAWVLLLVLLDNLDKQVKALIASFVDRPAPPPNPYQAPPKLKKVKKEPFDIGDHIRRDYATRPGEEHLEIMDGLTATDIHQLRESHRPRLRIGGMPERYAHAWPHIWTLLDHLSYDCLRKDAMTAIKMSVPRSLHAWIDERATTVGGWRDIRMCRQTTPEATVGAMRRAAWQAEECRRQELAELEKSSRDRHNNSADEDIDDPSPRS